MTNNISNYKDVVNTCPKCGSANVQMDPTLALTSYPVQFNFMCQECNHTWTDFEKTQFPTRTAWPNLEQNISIEPFNYGWICPKCGRVYSPTTRQCLFCGGTYSPDMVYCGSNISTTTALDNMTISNTVDNFKVNATMADMAKNALHEELQNSLKNSKK